MLNSEFTQEMGALLRRLQEKVRTQPTVRSDDPKDRIEQAIIALVAIRLDMEKL